MAEGAVQKQSFVLYSLKMGNEIWNNIPFSKEHGRKRNDEKTEMIRLQEPLKIKNLPKFPRIATFFAIFGG